MVRMSKNVYRLTNNSLAIFDESLFYSHTKLLYSFRCLLKQKKKMVRVLVNLEEKKIEL